MKIRLLGLTAVVGIACGDATQPETAAAGAGARALPLSGTYRVAGTTVDKASGAKRDVRARSSSRRKATPTRRRSA